MRKIKVNTKILMAIFTIFCASASIVFVLVGSYSNKLTHEIVKIDANTILFVDNEKVTFDTAVEIEKNFEEVWIAVKPDGSKSTLGNNVIIIEDQTIQILGGGYQIFSDQTVLKISENYRIDDLFEESFFKLNDRRYLFISPQIMMENNEDGTFENYLYIVLDKAGNGQLFSKDKLIKTTKEVLLKGIKNEFNISKEVLLMDGVEADLKRIYGTTSTYLTNSFKDNDLLNYDESYDNAEEINLTIKGGDGGKGGVGGDGGVGGTGGTGGTGAVGGGSSSGGGTGQEARKSMQLNKIEAFYDTLKINYTVIDPLGQLGVTWIRIFDYTDSANPLKVQEINIDPMGTDFTAQNLIPGTRYQVMLGYTSEESQEDDNFVQQDSMKVMTNLPNTNIALVEQSDTKIVFNIKVNKNYRPDTLQVGVLSANDGFVINKVDVDLNVACEANGQLLELDFSDKNQEILQLKVLSAKKGGVEVKFSGYATFYNKLFK